MNIWNPTPVWHRSMIFHVSKINSKVWVNVGVMVESYAIGIMFQEDYLFVWGDTSWVVYFHVISRYGRFCLLIIVPTYIVCTSDEGYVLHIVLPRSENNWPNTLGNMLGWRKVGFCCVCFILKNSIDNRSEWEMFHGLKNY